MNLVIWHNPRCSTSRKTMTLLRERGLQPEVVEYLKTPPTAEQLRTAVAQLGKPASAMVRRREPAFKEAGLDRGSPAEADYIAAMVRYPVLIERPIVFHGNKAALGRPPEAVLAIL
jgi:arsenate reductase (glutaredoxin)